MSAAPILWPDQALDPSRVGGKAAALARLAAIAPVPPWFVVPPEAEPPFRLDGALARLGPGPFAVRSSAIGEDAAGHAHAGQFLSLLHVPAAEVGAAIAAVRASGRTEALAAYRRAHGLPPETEVAVLVQLQVTPRVAGIAFSLDPVSGDEGVFVISAVAGLADDLAQGRADGLTWRLEAASGKPAAAPEDGAGLLASADLAALHRLIRDVAAAGGSPQDLEWAIEDGTLWLLQARPVTGLDPDRAVTVWDNANIVESYPGIVAPLTFSFARHVYAHVYRVLLGLLGVPPARVSAIRPALENLLGRHDGRVYYNLLHWYRMLAELPGFALNRRFMEQMMGVDEALPAAVADSLAPPPATGWGRLHEWSRLARVGLTLAWRALTLQRTAARFTARLEAALAAPPPSPADPPTALAAAYRDLEAWLLERWDAPLLNDLICMIAFGASRAVMRRWAGAEGEALHAAVMVGQGDIISAEPAARLRAMAALLAADPCGLALLERGTVPEALREHLAAYLARFGDRCVEELKLESVPLSDDPAPLLAAIAGLARSGPSAVPSRPDPEAELARLFAGRRLRRLVARRLLDWARARVRDRENLRYLRTLLFGRVRRLLLAMGHGLAERGLLDRPRDVFLLTIDEVLGAIEGGAPDPDLRGSAARRAEAMAGYAALPDPPSRFETSGAVALNRRRARVVAPEAGENSRQGLGCSPGLARGRARVVTDPRGQTLADGEILVATHTDPGWITLFTAAAGIIVERGSLLSHSAIVARELGIPCVVGLKGATVWLRDGDLLHLDGASGIVTRDPA